MAEDLDLIEKNNQELNKEYEEEIKKLSDYKSYLLKSLGEIEAEKERLNGVRKTLLENLRDTDLKLQTIEWEMVKDK